MGRIADNVLKARGETVLLAEDDQYVRASLKEIFREFGYRVIEAADGADAVEAFIDNADAVKLLVFDVVMPKMDGKKAYEEIRSIRPEVKVIFMSGYADNVIDKNWLRDNGLLLMQKPVSPEELLKEMKRVIGG